jgi:hypothetical protein
MSTFLGFLSDNCQSQSQSNTVVVQWKEMDRVGAEPKTSDAALAFLIDPPV